MKKHIFSTSFTLKLSHFGGDGGGLSFLLPLLFVLVFFSCEEENLPAPQTDALTCLLVNQGNYYDNVAGTLFFPSGQSLLIGDTPQNAVLLDSLLYVPCHASSDLAIVSLTTGTVLSRIPLTAPQHICTDGQRLFVTQGDGTLAVINPQAPSLSLAPPSLPYWGKISLYERGDVTGSELSPKGGAGRGLPLGEVGGGLGGLCPYACVASNGHVYINCGTSADGLHPDNRVVVVNAATLAVERTITVGNNPYDQIAADADGNVFTVCLGDYSAAPEVWKIAPEGTAAPCATGNLIATHGHTLYVAHVQADWSTWPEVTATTDYATLDTRTGALQPLQLLSEEEPVYPSCLAISSTDGNLYIASDAAPGNYNSPGSLHVFSPSGTHLASYPAGPHPYCIVFPPKR